jgi:hypothetical protein
MIAASKPRLSRLAGQSETKSQNGQSMENQPIPLFSPAHPCFLEAKALSHSVKAIRRAQGKSVPSDFVHGSPEWEASALEFVRDLEKALGDRKASFR